MVFSYRKIALFVINMFLSFGYLVCILFAIISPERRTIIINSNIMLYVIKELGYTLVLTMLVLLVNAAFIKIMKLPNPSKILLRLLIGYWILGFVGRLVLSLQSLAHTVVNNTG